MQRATDKHNTAHKKILICPMDWGLGHASRDIEIIHHLIKLGNEVIIGADSFPLLLLKEHFPDLKTIVIPSFKISYPQNGFMVLKMLSSAPKLLLGIWKEHRLLKEIVEKHQIDIVISDNRFGLWNRNTHNIFITHQLWIKAPKHLRFVEPIINFINHWFMKKYNECWVPDFEHEPNLSGELSHPVKKPVKVKYIGTLSRFNLPKNEPFIIKVKDKFDILVLLSGPEPQRTLLEEKLVDQILQTNYKTLVLRGKPGKNEQIWKKNILFLNHLATDELKEIIINTPVIICRSGYSSIMDLVTLKKNAILIPTPGQTEQEYLAEYLMKKECFFAVAQKDFQLEKALNELEKYKISCKFGKHELNLGIFSD